MEDGRQVCHSLRAIREVGNYHALWGDGSHFGFRERELQEMSPSQHSPIQVSAGLRMLSPSLSDIGH